MSRESCKAWQVVTDGPADGDAVLLPRVTEAEFKAKAHPQPVPFSKLQVTDCFRAQVKKKHQYQCSGTSKQGLRPKHTATSAHRCFDLRPSVRRRSGAPSRRSLCHLPLLIREGAACNDLAGLRLCLAMQSCDWDPGIPITRRNGPVSAREQCCCYKCSGLCAGRLVAPVPSQHQCALQSGQ